MQLTSKYYRKSHASDELNRLFGVLPSNLSVEVSFFPFSRGYLLYSALHSIYLCLINPSSLFISRNIYSSLFYAILFKNKFILINSKLRKNAHDSMLNTHVPHGILNAQGTKWNKIKAQTFHQGSLQQVHYIYWQLPKYFSS